MSKNITNMPLCCANLIILKLGGIDLRVSIYIFT